MAADVTPAKIEADMTPHNRLAPVPSRTRFLATTEQLGIPTYRVGELFAADRAQWSEGAQYSHGRMGHELTLFVANPTPEAVAGIRRGKVRFALSEAGPIFYLAYRFEGSPGWADVPYCWHVQHPAARATPPAEADASPESRALLWITLVDANNGLILAQRGVTLCPGFTRALHRAIRAQAAAPFDSLECLLAIAETSRERPDAARRLNAAYVWTTGNA